ncbi:Putative glycosyl transferase CAP10 domain-containing protein [Septoria linicola]|uniref:Glycosyl transferase CAP10 domain-containing protein n=1 Tax=Septoria linicola TaxID=215465 RepID=A0A9Q9EL50_9PEZI|nr:putative glycosyl transferase CAP10 domain-containing protein [Septoria linicola]USW54735.1 Putative glycosyl transferase CAP10 domain-containing protein [Septoria linicola]
MNGHRRGVWPAVSGLVVGSAILSRAIPTSFAFDRPIHSCTAILAGAGGAVVASSRWLPKDHEERGRKDRRQYGQLPLTEVGRRHASRESSPAVEAVTYASSQRKLRILVVLLVALICLRVELLRQVVDNVQCATNHWNVWIPLALSAWEYWIAQKSSSHTISQHYEVHDEPSLLREIAVLPYARVLTTLAFTFGGSLVLDAVASPASTYICAASLHYRVSVPVVQRFSSLLDVAIVYCFGELLRSRAARKTLSTINKFALIGLALLVCAGFWLVVGGVYWFVQETGRKWLLTIPPHYFWSVMKLNVYIAFTLICALLTIHHIGAVKTSVIATATSIITTTTTTAWSNAHPFPMMHMGLAFLGIFILILAFMFYLNIEAHVTGRSTDGSEQDSHKIPAWTYVFFMALMLLWVGIWLSYHRVVAFHPIDMAMYEAQGRHETFVAQASASRTLAEATQAYRLRYKRHPPPGFYDWFEYATKRSSTVIDDFDSIYRDLLPFHALSPGEIRERTWTLIANPWNDAAGISIRAGKVAISPNVVPTHLWMLEGIVSMISKFADSLPDMDLAFNLNDECRISVPYEDVEPMRALGRQPRLPNEVDKTWTSSRNEQWRQVPEEPLHDSPLWEASWEPVFHRFGNHGCPPNSPARARRAWDAGVLCRSCVRQHSLGAFLSNWTTAGDVCHQPDLADLHGLYLSPAAFKTSSRLYPVFSQSKAGGFNDILYPSAWNYIDKAKYEPTVERPDSSFAEKKPVLFWRGATSEGFSHGGFTGQWRGMARQRFVHITNNINGTTPDQSLLVNSATDKMHYESFPVKQLSSFLATDVHFVDSIVRCGGRDCSDQAQEFAPLVPPLDFQDHWHYKYLLDLDGAGFSGRFLPFLRSNSLPFKAALFREWWDDRVEAWVHFVPLDIRGHGLWATLAYFQGLYAKIGGKEIAVEAHQREAERIASQGKEWAERVLRKEDMEIYMFRLLLEWGRLTDDKRDMLGFTG